MLGLLTGLVAQGAGADIVLDRTRLIYLASERDVSITLTNLADSPRLVQAWIDAGDARVPAEYSDVPFTVTPPIVRIDPGKGHALRIAVQAPPALATETVYWLNVLSIRPTPTAQTGNVLQWAFRTRIKVFLRAVQRPDGDQPTLLWRINASRLEVHNPSAYYVTVSRVTLRVDGREYRSDTPPMVAPQATLPVPLNHGFTPTGRATVGFSLIDDHGVTRDYEQRL